MPPKIDKQNKVAGPVFSNYMSFQALNGGIGKAPNVFVDGRCNQCESDNTAETVSCLFCKDLFHISNCFSEDALDCVAPSGLKSFVNAVTKSGAFAKRNGNFRFICDPCLTQFEISQTSSTHDKVQALDNRVTRLYTELSEGIGQIKELLSSSFDSNKSTAAADGTDSTDDTNSANSSQNVWSNTEAVRSLLVVDKNVALDPKSIEKTAIENGIPIDKCSLKDSNTGNSVFILPSQKARDQLKDSIQQLHPELTDGSFKTPQPRLPTISIVGIPCEVDQSHDSITATIMAQNEWISNLCSPKGTGTFKVLTVKSTRNNSMVHQAIVCVSDDVRQVIRSKNDKVFFGMRSCTVYDQWYVKRCNKCQLFGHYAKQCGNRACCGYCAADDHESQSCPNKNVREKLCCKNCKTAGNTEAHTHPAYSQSCPMYIAKKDSLRASITSRSKNLSSATR